MVSESSYRRLSIGKGDLFVVLVRSVYERGGVPLVLVVLFLLILCQPLVDQDV